jgi:plasmid stability protein
VSDVLIRNVPKGVLEALKRRAEEHHRSLQGELLTILEEAAAEPSRSDLEEFLREATATRERLASTGRTFSDSADLVREDRDR